MTLIRNAKFALAAIGLGCAALLSGPAVAVDLGIEGKVYETIEEDFRITLMRLVARQDWTQSQEELTESANDYTKNLPAYFMNAATETKTVWKDVGIIVTENIYLPTVDWETGSVFEPTQVLIAEAGTYFNPIAKLPAAGIERLFLFDATDPEQLALARALMVQDIPQLHFMLVAGDLGPLAKEMNRPIYHPTPTMIEKFHITSVPTLIGFGRAQHQGHMAVTSFKLPTDMQTITSAWFGLPYPGYDPEMTQDVIPTKASALTAGELSTGDGLSAPAKAPVEALNPTE